MNAAVCQNRGQPNTTARNCTRCNPTESEGKLKEGSPLPESSAAVADSERDHHQVLAPAS